MLLMAAAALLLPAARDKALIVSPALMAGYAVLLMAWSPELRLGRLFDKFPARAALLIGFIAAAFLIQRVFAETFSHVFELVFNKIILLGALPADPARLSFDTKVQWTSSFVSPRLDEIPVLLWFSLPFGLIGLAVSLYRIFKKEAGGPEILSAYFTIATILLFLMFHRMSVLVAFFLALSIGAVALFKKPFHNFLVYLLLGMCFVFQVGMLREYSLLPFRPNQEDVKSVISFLKDDTDRSLPVLSSFELGSSIALYGGHPVNLHSKFESPVLWKKVKEVYMALFGPEEDFFRLCKRFGAGFFVYQDDMALGTGPGSMKYIVGVKQMRTDCPAFLFHFAPEKLKHFRLVYQNGTYRVFLIEGAQFSGKAVVKYDPLYDPDVFFEGGETGEFVEDKTITAGYANLRASGTWLKAGDRFFKAGDYQTAMVEYERALMLDRGSAAAGFALAAACARAGVANKATDALRLALSLEPAADLSRVEISDPDIWLTAGEGLFSDRDFPQAESAIKKALKLDPGSERARLSLAMAYFSQNKNSEAEAEFKKVVSLNPGNVEAWENLGKIYAASKDWNRAIAAIEKCAELNPASTQYRRVLNMLRSEAEKASRR